MTAAPARPSGPPPEAIVRAAWLYYAEGLTQERIARTLGVSRARVIAWLALARDEGLVAVRIGGKGSAQVELERALCKRFGLAEAVVVPAPAQPPTPPRWSGTPPGRGSASACATGWRSASAGAPRCT